jgi:hypothetical protein
MNMKKYLMLLVVALFFTAANAFDKGEWTGFITDDKCGVKGNNKAHAACAKDCVKKGAKIVFVSGDKVYALKDTKIAEGFVGEEVTITGSITNGVMKITKIVGK